MRSSPIEKCNKAALGLRAPVAVGRHVDAAHRIGLVTLAGRVDADRDVPQDGDALDIHVAFAFHGLTCNRVRPPSCDRDPAIGGKRRRVFAIPAAIRSLDADQYCGL